MSKILVTMILVGSLFGVAPLPAQADNNVVPIWLAIDPCVSPYLWLYKASEWGLDPQWYTPVARAFNHFAETGDDYALSCVVRWMGLESFWPEYRAYCVGYINSPAFEYMAEPYTFRFVAWVKR